MVYPLKPVIEEIQRSSEESGDRRISKMCLGMLKALKNRPEHNCVAYRKAIPSTIVYDAVSFSCILALNNFSSSFNVLAISVFRVLELFATKRADLVLMTLLLSSLERYVFICPFSGSWRE
jgi:hypothetical protein